MTGFEHLERQLKQRVRQLRIPSVECWLGCAACAGDRILSRSSWRGSWSAPRPRPAVVSLNASASQPLAGGLPHAAGAASAPQYRYSITVVPGLSAGSAGWGTSVTYRNALGVAVASGGGGGA